MECYKSSRNCSDVVPCAGQSETFTYTTSLEVPVASTSGTTCAGCALTVTTGSTASLEAEASRPVQSSTPSASSTTRFIRLGPWLFCATDKACRMASSLCRAGRWLGDAATRLVLGGK